MAAAGSLHLCHELGMCKNHQRNKQFRSGIRSGNLHLFGANLSSLALRQDSWSIYLSDKLHRPIQAVPYRYNLLKCHSYLNLGHCFNISSVKTATSALTRSFTALQGRPVIVKLVPAVGIVVFAVWGLGPLMRQIRNILLQKSDSSWKKSRTYYVMASYIQPLLLWTGATLICRSLDPVVLPSETGQIVKQRLLSFVRSLSTVLAFAYCLSSVIQQAQKFFMETNSPTDSRNMGFQFAGKAVYSAVWVAAVSLFMELLGFSTQKWLTAGGLGTVLLTLAGREIFTNFLSSAMIHATRPFVVNEWIQTKIEGYEVSGTVEHVGWWSPTIIRGEDREAVHIPNHKFTVNVVRNLTQKTHWRIKTHLAISHLDVNKINIIVADMRKVLAKNPQVEQQKLHRRVFLENVNPENQALLILVSCFVKTSHFEEYLCVKEAILLDLLRVISHHRARLATPIRTVQKIYSDSDMEGIPFAESVFTRGGPAVSNRPLLLIEPPYKINGDDRTKTQAQPKATARSTTDNKADAKSGTTRTSDSKAKEKSASDHKANEMVTSGLKADGKVGETENPNAKENKGVATTSLSDSKIDDKATTFKTSKSVSKTDSKFVDVSSIESNTAMFDNLTQNGSNNDQSKKVGLPKTGWSPSPSGSQSKQGERVPMTQQHPISRPALEENIVLGVALEGSKRTLPIEEDEMGPSPVPADVKELATQRSGGSGLQTGEKLKKDGQNSNVAGSATADQ